MLRQVVGAQITPDDLQAPGPEVGIQPAPPTGEIQHSAAPREAQERRQGGALLGRVSRLVRVDGKIEGMVEIPDEPVHGPSLTECEKGRLCPWENLTPLRSRPSRESPPGRAGGCSRCPSTHTGCPASDRS